MESKVPSEEPTGSELDAGEMEKKDEEIRKLNEKILRDYAEAENLRKRVAKDKTEWFKYANEMLLADLLAVLDNLYRARDHETPTEDVSKWVEGLSLTIKQFEEVLAKFNVKVIKALGTQFDPSVHQAVAQIESDEKEGTVVEEFQKGYRLHDRVLRPSMVAVSKKTKSEDLNEKGGNDG